MMSYMKISMMIITLLVAAVILFGQPLDPRELPRIQQSNISYVGSFALPTETFGTSRFGYGGGAISTLKDSATGRLTLFIHGHIQKDGQIAQIEVPDHFIAGSNRSTLPVAKVIQPFSDVTENRLSTVGDNSNPIHIYGTLAYHGRLIVAASQYYGSDQAVSHGVSGLTLSTTGDFKGFYGFTGATAIPRALGGWMTIVPEAWRTLVGGPALTGNGCIPIISATSVGPAATVFDPDDVGVRNPIPGTTLLFYPLGQGTMPVGSEASQNDTLNLTTRIAGMAFPNGSRSLLYFGGHGSGPYCYGTPQECSNDSALPDAKGPHAQPYRYQVWAYDVNDLLKVKNKTLPVHGPKPYGVWDMSAMGLTGTAVNVQGAGFDPESGLWFITVDYGENPRIDVLKVRLPGSVTNVATKVLPMQQLTLDIGIRSNAIHMTVHGDRNSSLVGEVLDCRGSVIERLTAQGCGIAGKVDWNIPVHRAGLYVVTIRQNGRILTGSVVFVKGKLQANIGTVSN